LHVARKCETQFAFNCAYAMYDNACQSAYCLFLKAQLSYRTAKI